MINGPSIVNYYGFHSECFQPLQPAQDMVRPDILTIAPGATVPADMPYPAASGNPAEEVSLEFEYMRIAS